MRISHEIPIRLGLGPFQPPPGETDAGARGRVGARTARKGTRQWSRAAHLHSRPVSRPGTGSGSQWGLSPPSASPRSLPLGPLLGAAQVCGLSRAVSQVSRCHRSRRRFRTPWAPAALALPSLPSPAQGALLLAPGETPRLPLVEKHLAVRPSASLRGRGVGALCPPAPALPARSQALPFLTAAAPPWVGRCPRLRCRAPAEIGSLQL